MSTLGPRGSVPRAIPPLGWVAAGLGVSAIVVVILMAFGLLRAWLGPDVGEDTLARDVERQAEQHSGAFAGYVGQINGRTLFVTPAAPSEVAAAQAEPEPDPNEPPPLPTRYGGPAIQAMVLDQVWLQDGRRVKAGETSGEIKVVSVNPPWEATIAWRGVEFKVPFFERDSVVIRGGRGGETTPSTAPEPAAGTPPAEVPSSPAPSAPAAPEAPGSPAAPETAPASGTPSGSGQGG